MTPKTFVVLLTMMTLSIQTFAGELGNSRGSESRLGSTKSESKLGSYKWLKGTCYKIENPVNQMVEDYAAAVKLCPPLKDYSDAQYVYFGSVHSETYKRPVPPHQPGWICASKNRWSWVMTPGIPGTECKVFDPRIGDVKGVRI